MMLSDCIQYIWHLQITKIDLMTQQSLVVDGL